MKRILLLLAMLGVAGFGEAKSLKTTWRVTIDGYRADCPVVIADVPSWAESVEVRSNGATLAAQLDKALGEAAFVADIALTRDFEVVFSDRPAKTTPASRVNAQMWWKNPDGSLAERDTLWSEKDDMYRKLHHHGPAIESDRAAYRV